MLYKTVWEIPQKKLIDLAIARAPFIDQSQSLNIHLSDPNYSKMTSMHFYSWKKGLKTGMYYLRSRPAVDAIKFTLNVEELLKASDSNDCDSLIKCIGANVTSNSDTKDSSGTVPDMSNGLKNNKDKIKQDEEPEVCENCSG